MSYKILIYENGKPYSCFDPKAPGFERINRWVVPQSQGDAGEDLYYVSARKQFILCKWGVEPVAEGWDVVERAQIIDPLQALEWLYERGCPLPPYLDALLAEIELTSSRPCHAIAATDNQQQLTNDTAKASGTAAGSTQTPSRRVVARDPRTQTSVAIDVSQARMWALEVYGDDWDGFGGYYNYNVEPVLYRQPSGAWLLVEERIFNMVDGIPPDRTYEQLTDAQAADKLLSSGIHPPDDLLPYVKDRLLGPDTPAVGKSVQDMAQGGQPPVGRHFFDKESEKLWVETQVSRLVRAIRRSPFMQGEGQIARSRLPSGLKIEGGTCSFGMLCLGPVPLGVEQLMTPELREIARIVSALDSLFRNNARVTRLEHLFDELLHLPLTQVQHP